MISRLCLIVAGLLYPVYNSFKAVRSRDDREHVRWMMYWVVFGLFTTAEWMVDPLIEPWLPLYCPTKILFVAWMVLPATQGSTLLYRRFVHPWFLEHEQEIDHSLERLKSSYCDAIAKFTFKVASLLVWSIFKVILKSVLQVVGQSDSNLKESWGSRARRTDRHPRDSTPPAGSPEDRVPSRKGRHSVSLPFPEDLGDAGQLQFYQVCGGREEGAEGCALTALGGRL